MSSPTATPPREVSPDPSTRGGWVRIDCTGTVDHSLTRVGGIPVVVRTIRLAARAGHRGAVIEGGDRGAIAAALVRWPAPAGFAIEHADAGAASADELPLSLAGDAVYAADELPAAAAEGREPRPLRRIASKADAGAATAELIRRTRKSIDADGVVSYFLFRPLSRAMSRVLVGTRITPNQTSLVAMSFGIAAAVCAAAGGWRMVALAGALYWIGAVIDCVDGELARVRLQGSKLGEWLDSLGDEISTYGLLAGLGVGMVRDGEPAWWGWMAAIGGAAGVLLNVKLMIDLHVAGRRVDTAGYPWFFGTPAAGGERRGVVGRAIYLFNFLLRRDAVATMVAIALAFGLRAPAVIGFMVGLALFTAMFFIHGVVVTIRRQQPSFWAIGYVGIKDLFTMVNLLGGVVGIALAIDGDLRWAGYAIFAGYLFGDAVDGQVARMTGTANVFGRELDAAADGVAQGLAPALIVYVAYDRIGQPELGLALLAALIGTATIRQARFAVAEFNYPGTYCGLPRTVSGLIAVSLPNTILFFDSPVTGTIGAAVFLFLVALLNLLPIPYLSHKGRRLPGYIRALVAGFLVIPASMVALAPEFVFDVLFVITFGYAMGAWAPLTADERRTFWVEYRRWSRELARK